MVGPHGGGELQHVARQGPRAGGECWADPSTADAVLAEHRDAVRCHGALGVPWLVLGGHALGYYGPVIDQVPRGELAGELWDRVAWLLDQPYFDELKRKR